MDGPIKNSGLNGLKAILSPPVLREMYQMDTDCLFLMAITHIAPIGSVNLQMITRFLLSAFHRTPPMHSSPVMLVFLDLSQAAGKARLTGLDVSLFQFAKKILSATIHLLGTKPLRLIQFLRLGEKLDSGHLAEMHWIQVYSSHH